MRTLEHNNKKRGREGKRKKKKKKSKKSHKFNTTKWRKCGKKIIGSDAFSSLLSRKKGKRKRGGVGGQGKNVEEMRESKKPKKDANRTCPPKRKKKTRS